MTTAERKLSKQVAALSKRLTAIETALKNTPFYPTVRLPRGAKP